MPIDREPTESPGSYVDDQDVPFATEWDLRGSDAVRSAPQAEEAVKRQEEETRKELQTIDITMFE